MNFEGATEDFGRETISDWASYLDNGNRTSLDVGLYFQAYSVVSADPRGATLDPNASHTVVPGWICTAIAV